MFMDLRPKAIACGCPVKDYKHLTVDELWDYIDAHKMLLQEQDIQNWYLGMYIRDAIASCFDKNSKYPKEPYLADQIENTMLTEDEREEKEMRKMIKAQMEWASYERRRGLKGAFEE